MSNCCRRHVRHEGCGSYRTSRTGKPNHWRVVSVRAHEGRSPADLGDDFEERGCSVQCSVGVVFDMLREAAAKRPGVLTEVGMETFVDPNQEGCAMNEAAREVSIAHRVRFEGEE